METNQAFSVLWDLSIAMGTHDFIYEALLEHCGSEYAEQYLVFAGVADSGVA